MLSVVREEVEERKTDRSISWAQEEIKSWLKGYYDLSRA
jgi:hypothetical protein